MSILLTKSYTYEPGVDIIPGGGQNSDSAIDYKYNTFWQSPVSGFPLLIIDFGEPKSIDSLWFHSTNVATYHLGYSNSSSSFTNVFTSARTGRPDGYNYQIGFAKQSARFWRLLISTKNNDSTPVNIYEIQLMELLLDTRVLNRPLQYIFHTSVMDSGQYRTLGDNGDLASYATLSERGKQEFSLEWKYLPDSVLNSLRRIWNGPPVKPVITVFPNPDISRDALTPDTTRTAAHYPGKIYQARWNNEFSHKYSTIVKTAGSDVVAEFKEV